MASTLSGTSLSGLGLSGLSSGLDTSAIITKLMSIEQGPQTALKTKLAAATQFRTALQAVNTQVATMATSAKASAEVGSLASYTATSDSAATTVTASSSASAGSVSFTVDRLASPQISVSDAMSTWPDSSSTTPSITISTGGTTKTVAASSNDLDDVVGAINGSGTGVTATKVATGQKDSAGKALFRLQLRGASGADNGFALSQGSASSSTPLPTTQIAAAADAQLTLFGGSTAQQTVGSATNTFSDLLTGVDVTVRSASTAATTITIAEDATAATTAAQGLAASLITLFAGIANASAVTTSSSSTGSTTSTTGGIFTGDSGIRGLKDALLSAATDAVTTSSGLVSPSSIGFTLTKSGTITFDQAKFAAAMESDPDGATAVFQTIAGRIATAASGASDPATGTLTRRIASQQTAESSMTKEVGDWDTRLAVIQAQYTAQFNALETALQSLSSQSSYLTSQIAGLTTNYQNK